MTNRNRKLKPETIEKIGFTAIGVGSAILYLANEDFRKGIDRSVQNRLNTAPQKDSTRGTQGRGAYPAYSGASPQPSHFTSTNPTKGVVYLLKAGPFYKIGKTLDFRKRLNQIKLQLPYPVVVIHRIVSDDITATERYWHKKFAHQHTNGEWFTLNDSEVIEFKSIVKM